MRTPGSRSVTTLLLLGVVLSVAVPSSALTIGPINVATPAPNLIVGFDTRAVDVALLTTLGATVASTSDSLGIAAVYVPNVAAFSSAILLDPHVAWVERNVAVRMSSSGWDSSGWDSSGWDSSGWDSSGWDSSGWDSSGWDSSGWDSSGWDSSGWDSSGWDSSGWDSSGWDSSGWDSSGWDSSGWDSSGWDSAKMTTLGRTPAGAGKDPLVRWQWGLAAVNASASDVRSGTGARAICVLDSGVDATHPDLAGRVLPGRDFVNKDNDASDDAGHGTHVAGIASAVTGNGLGIAGMSNTKILPGKVLAKNGVGLESDLALGIKWCQEKGASVISMSLGTDQNMKAVHRAVVDAFAAGIVLVASAGNTGSSCDCVHYPAAYPQVVSVGAVNPAGKRANFSAASDGVDFAAPGYAIVSTLPGAKYGEASGTSQAAPYVSALAALLLDDGHTGASALQAMKATATDLGPDGQDPYVGYGVPNYGAALALR